MMGRGWNFRPVIVNGGAVDNELLQAAHIDAIGQQRDLTIDHGDAICTLCVKCNAGSRLPIYTTDFNRSRIPGDKGFSRFALFVIRLLAKIQPEEFTKVRLIWFYWLNV